MYHYNLLNLINKFIYHSYLLFIIIYIYIYIYIHIYHTYIIKFYGSANILFLIEDLVRLSCLSYILEFKILISQRCEHFLRKISFNNI